jgi:hypothetical protein
MHHHYNLSSLTSCMATSPCKRRTMVCLQALAPPWALLMLVHCAGSYMIEWVMEHKTVDSVAGEVRGTDTGLHDAS